MARFNPVNHGWDNDLEPYVLGRLTPDRVDQLEDHLLECEPCRNAVDETAAYCETMRQELAHPPETKSWTFPEVWSKWLRVPAFSLAVAALLAVVAAGWILNRPAVPSIPLASIQLLAMRGDMPVVDRALETELRFRDAQGESQFPRSVEVVDANGGTVWKGRLAPVTPLRIDKPLAAGVYFVRIYNGQALLREYGFRVK